MELSVSTARPLPFVLYLSPGKWIMLATLTMVFKPAREAESRRRKLNASQLLAEVIDGVIFKDGELKQDTA